MHWMGMIGCTVSGALLFCACGDSTGAGGAGGGTGSTTTATSSSSKASSVTGTGTTGTGTTGTGSGGTGKIGDACMATGDCIMGYFCAPPPDDPGGQCLKTCNVQTDCPTGSTCTDENKCYKSCNGPADCTRAGYACVAAMTVTNTPTMTCDVAPMTTTTGSTSSTGTGN